VSFGGCDDQLPEVLKEPLTVAVDPTLVGVPPSSSERSHPARGVTPAVPSSASSRRRWSSIRFSLSPEQLSGYPAHKSAAVGSEPDVSDVINAALTHLIESKANIDDSRDDHDPRVIHILSDGDIDNSKAPRPGGSIINVSVRQYNDCSHYVPVHATPVGGPHGKRREQSVSNNREHLGPGVTLLDRDPREVAIIRLSRSPT
jgi:hypothetical protein